MHIFAAALNTETNTFSPFPTGRQDFHILHQSDFERDPERVHGLGCLTAWHRLSQQSGHRMTLSLTAHAEPSGLVVRSVYESLRDEILADLEDAGPLDIVLLDLHGAMVAEGYDDCEGDLLRRVRSLVGEDVTVAVELDLHCHLTAQMLRSADLIVCYKEYPHFDINDRAVELFDLALRTQQGSIAPTMALFDCRMMGMYSTTEQPMRGFVDSMKALEAREGVLSVSFGHGFPWGDVAEAGGKMLVVTDNNPLLADELARELGLAFFSLRGSVEFRSLPLEQALSQAAASERGPVVVADQSDNPGGGAPSDSTFALEWLLANHAGTAAVAILYDPVVVQIAKSAGPGAQLSVRVGGKMSPQSGNPLDLAVTVLAVHEDYHHRFPQQDGQDYMFSIGDAAALRCGGVDIIVSSRRGQCFSPCILSDFGLDPGSYDIIIPKSTQHFHGGFAPMAAEIIYMAAPGAIAPLIERIPYQKMKTTDKYPWNKDPHGGGSLAPDEQVF